MSTRYPKHLDRFFAVAAANLRVLEAMEAAEADLNTLSEAEKDELFQRMWQATVGGEASQLQEPQAAAPSEVIAAPPSQAGSVSETLVALRRLLGGLVQHALQPIQEVISTASSTHRRTALSAAPADHPAGEMTIAFPNGIKLIVDKDLSAPNAPPDGWLLKCPDDFMVNDNGTMIDARTRKWRLVWIANRKPIGSIDGLEFNAQGEIEIPFADGDAFFVELVPDKIEPL